MSLEKVIEENTAAMRDLIAAMASMSFAAPKAAEQVKAAGETMKAAAEKLAPEKAKKSDAGASTKAATATQAAESAAPVVPEDDEPKAVTLEDVSALVVQIVKGKGRTAAIELLGTFGAAKAPELKAKDYEAFAVAAKEVLAAEDSLV